MYGINPGWYYDKTNDKMAYDSMNEYKDLSEEARTAIVVEQIANMIDENIRVTVDSPEKNENGKVPRFWIWKYGLSRIE